MHGLADLGSYCIGVSTQCESRSFGRPACDLAVARCQFSGWRAVDLDRVGFAARCPRPWIVDSAHGSASSAHDIRAPSDLARSARKGFGAAIAGTIRTACHWIDLNSAMDTVGGESFCSPYCLLAWRRCDTNVMACSNGIRAGIALCGMARSRASIIPRHRPAFLVASRPAIAEYSDISVADPVVLVPGDVAL